jgi:hypothetical protein
MRENLHRGVFLLPNILTADVLDDRDDIQVNGGLMYQGRFIDWLFEPSEFIDDGYGVCPVNEFPFVCLSQRKLSSMREFCVSSHYHNMLWFAVYPMSMVFSKSETILNTQSHWPKTLSVLERRTFNFHDDTAYEGRRVFAVGKGWKLSDDGKIVIPIDSNTYYPTQVSGHMIRALLLVAIGVFDFNLYMRNIEANLRGKGTAIEGMASSAVWHSLLDWVAAILYAKELMQEISLPLTVDIDRIINTLIEYSLRHKRMYASSFLGTDNFRIDGEPIAVDRNPGGDFVKRVLDELL